MLAELSSTMAILVGRTEKTGSLRAKINNVRSSNGRKKTGGKWMRPHGPRLVGVPDCVKRIKLENVNRRGRFLVRYGISRRGSAKKPSKAVGFRNSMVT
jgi:hypothetical protein